MNRSLNALLITLTDDSTIAAAPISGDIRMSKVGFTAIGIAAPVVDEGEEEVFAKPSPSNSLILVKAKHRWRKGAVTLAIAALAVDALVGFMVARQGSLSRLRSAS